MHRAIFYEFPETDPDADRFVHRTSDGDVTIVLAGDLSLVPAAARDLAGKGVELIELCGGMPLSVRAGVRAAVSGATRVASVAFGIESIVKAAEFNHAFMEGTPPAEACLVMAPGADPVSNRFERRANPQQVSFIMVDDEAAPDIARGLAEQGAGLLELYGGFSDATAVKIIDAVAGRCAVGLSGFGHPVSR